MSATIKINLEVFKKSCPDLIKEMSAAGGWYILPWCQLLVDDVLLASYQGFFLVYFSMHGFLAKMCA